MGLSELGGGKISCADFKNILRGTGRSAKNVGEYCVFNYDDVGGLIDMEQGRLNGPSLIQMIISLIIMLTKYIILFLISKIEYVAAVPAIYISVMIFLKMWRWLFDGQDGIIGGPVCTIANYRFDLKVPQITVLDHTFGGENIVNIQPFKKILSPITNLIGCPAGADHLFDNKYGSCEARFAGSATGCLNTYATDFTLYTENKNGTANKDAICGNIGHCKNAPEHNIIKDSIGFPVIGLPMVGLKGIGFGTAPFKYLECCPNGDGFTGSTSTNTNSKCSLELKKKAWQASLASSASPQEFKIKYKYKGTTVTGTPFEEFNMYSITNSNFDEFHIYNTDNKTCVNDGFFADLEDDLTKVINYIKIIFWVLIVLLIFIQVNTFVKRMYYGYILCETYDDAKQGKGKSKFDDTLLGIMSKKDPNHKIKELNSKVKSTVDEFEEKFPVCGHLLYCLNNKLPRKCGNEGDLNLQLHHKGNLISTLKNGADFNAKSNHSSGKNCFNEQHDIVSKHHNEISAKKNDVKNEKALDASKGAPSTLLGGDIPPEAFLIIIFSFISGTIMMIINYMKKK